MSKKIASAIVIVMGLILFILGLNFILIGIEGFLHFNTCPPTAMNLMGSTNHFLIAFVCYMVPVFLFISGLFLVSWPLYGAWLYWKGRLRFF